MIEHFHTAKKLDQELEQISPKIHLKNSHLFTQMLIHHNKILLVGQSTIQVHSLQSIMSHLPSLIQIIDIEGYLIPPDREDCRSIKDQLTYQVTETNKKHLGEQIFPNNLNSQSNIFMNGQMLEDRLIYLSGQNVRIDGVEISMLGDLFVRVSDNRALFLSRFVIDCSRGLKADEKKQYVVNLHELYGSIFGGNFSEDGDLLIMCSSREKEDLRQGESTVSLKNPILHSISLTDKGQIIKNRIIGHKKQPKLQTKGLIKIFYLKSLPLSKHSTSIILFYIDKITLIELNQPNQQYYPIMKYEDIHIKANLNNQYLNNVWHYSFWDQSSEEGRRNKIFYVTNGCGIWRLNFNWHQSENVSIEKLQKSVNTFKSQIYYMNFEGSFCQNFHNQNSMAAQTQNGLLVKLIRGSDSTDLSAYSNNYKDGFLIVFCPIRSYITRKLLQNIQHAHFLNFPINYSDLQTCFTNNSLSSIQIHTSFRKQILEQLTRLNKILKQSTKNKQKPFINQDLLNTVIYNALLIFDSKPVLSEKIQNQAISRWFRNKIGKQRFMEMMERIYKKEGGTKKEKQVKQKDNYGGLLKDRCYFSGKKIMVEELMYCERCKFYAIKDELPENRPICYICLHSLIEI